MEENEIKESDKEKPERLNHEREQDAKRQNEEFDKNRTLTDNNILACQSELIETLLSSVCDNRATKGKADLSSFSMENIENLYYTPDGDYYLRDTTEEPEEEIKEIMQWFLITDWLAKKLKEEGEPVLSNEFGDWWGRTTCGSAIYTDSVFTNIRKKIDAEIDAFLKNPRGV